MIDLIDVGNISLDPISKEDFYDRELPIAVFIILFDGIAIFVYLLVIFAILRDKECKKLIAYQLIIQVGIADIIQLICHTTASYFLLNRREMYGFVPQLIGAIINGGWCTMLVLSIILTLNRFITIVFYNQSDEIFHPYATLIYIMLCWIFCLSIIIFNMCGLSKFLYIVPLYTWQYEVGYPWGKFLHDFSNDLSIVNVFATVILYAIIFSYIQIKAKILSKKELYLTIQILAMGAFHVFGFLIWQYLPIPNNQWAVFGMNFVWMLWNAVNPFLYLSINPRIRKSSRIILGCVKEEDKTLFSVSEGKATRRN